jgi:chromosomal replication initiation ATPase DnaA
MSNQNAKNMHYDDLGLALAQFVEVSLTCEADRIASYAKHLAKCLRHVGDDETATQIDAIITSRQASTARPARSAQNGGTPPIPVDSESRLPVADEHVVVDPVEVILPDGTNEVIQRFLSSIRQADELRKAGVGVPNSLLLFGPPGCGKTLLAHSISQSLSRPIITARADGLVSSFLGSTAKNIRALFDHARRKECVLLLDEFDAIAKLRDDRHELGELKRVVIALLQNIDAAKDSIIFVAATNHPHLLDPAVWRRFSYSVEIPLPDNKAREALLNRFFGPHLPQDAVSFLATLTDGLSGADLKKLTDDVRRDAVLSGKGCLELGEVVRLLFGGHLRCSGDTKTMSAEDAIRFIRRTHGKKAAPQARLAELFGMTQPQVSRILAGG